MTRSKDALPSRHTTEGVENAFHRVFYYAMGLSTEEIHRPHVGVVAAWDDSLPAHAELRSIVDAAKGELWAGGTTPREFTTIAGFDAVPGGGPGGDGDGEGLLLSRELIADSIELTVRGHSYDVLVAVGGSSLALAGLAMAACRLEVPAVVAAHVPAPAGPSATGWTTTADDDAAAMAAAVAVLGLAAAGASVTASGAGVLHEAGRRAGAVAIERLDGDVRPRSFVTPGSLVDAAAAVGSVPTSFDPLLHLLAIANECGVAVTLEALVDAAAGGGGHHRPAFLRGSLAPDGCVAVAPPGTGLVRGTARVAASGAEAVDRIERGAWGRGDVVVVRDHGPRSGPGMPVCRPVADACAAVAGHGPVAVVTDGRAPAVAGLVTVWGVTPESPDGPLGVVADGDGIAIDVAGGTIELDVPAPELERRRTRAVASSPAGVAAPALWKYRGVVGPATAGAVTHPGGAGERHVYADL